MQLLSAIVMGVVAFASTNADNLLVLSSLRSIGAVGGRGLASGYLLGLAGVLVLTLLVGALSRLIPVHLVGFLGVVPIVLGLRQLVGDSGPDDGRAASGDGGRGEVALVATLQLANSGDTVAVGAPLLAESAIVPGLFTLAAFVATGIAWLWLIEAVVRLAGVRVFLERYAPRVGPFLMMAVGSYVLANTLTDTLPD